MDDANLNRRLAAILFVDVVGYSRLMGLDEQGTHEAMQKLHQTVLQPAIGLRGGQIRKVMGDGVLAEFASAVNCVAAAIDLQTRVAEVNRGTDADRQIVVRIGINLADVIGDGSDIFGDGVNIAARLEGIAEPGGICISEKVFNEVQGKLPFVATDLGLVALKNIAAPVRAFSIHPGGAGTDARTTGTPSRPAKADAPDPPHLGNILAVVIGYPGIVIGLGLMGLPPVLYLALSVWLLLAIVATYQVSRPDLRQGIAASLRDRTFTQVYTRMMNRPITALWNAYCDPVKEPAGVGALLRGALTWRVFDTALLLAVTYPLLLMFLIWAYNGSGAKLGNLELIPEEPAFWPFRAILIVIVALAVSLTFWRRLAAVDPTSRVRHLSRWLPWGIVLLSLVILGASFLIAVVAVAFALFDTGVVAVGVSLVLALVLSGADVAVATEFWVSVVIMALAGLAAAIYLDRTHRSRAARLLICALIVGAWITGAFGLEWGQTNDDNRISFFLLAVLPLLNALVDAVSYAVTLALIRRGINVGMPVLLGALDVVLALVLFLALGAILVTVVAGLNRLAGASLLDLGLFFAGIWDSWQPVGPEGLRPHLWDYAWVYTMLFSAAVPTVLHLMVSLIGLQGVTPHPLRLRLAERLDAASPGSGEMIVQAGLISLVWFVPFVLAGTLVAALWWLGMSSGLLGVLGQGYFDALLWLASLQGAF